LKVAAACNFRRFSESGYLVHYLINDETKTIEIHHVWHGMRNIGQLLQEMEDVKQAENPS